MISLSVPMERGVTAYGGSAIDASNLLFGNQIGQVRAFPDVNPNTKVFNSGLETVAMLIRNVTAGALLPKQSVLLSGVTIGNSGATITQSATPNVFCGIVDEYLPAAGCPVNDCCWVILRGPTTVLIDSSAGAPAGQLYMPSGTSNGKFDIIDPTPDDDLEAMNQAIYALGTAIQTVAAAATEARICLRNNQFGQ